MIRRHIILCFLAFPLPMLAQNGLDFVHVKNTLTNEVDLILRETGIPSITISLFTNDSILWEHGFGYANVELKKPASPNTIYNTGSCFKPVTSMAMMQLAERGKLSLDNPISYYIGERVVPGQSVTIRHLLSHYSGIAAPTEFVPLTRETVVKSLTEITSNVTIERPPGISYAYSNVAYAIAGLIIERVSGQSYGKYIAKQILEPLRLDNSSLIDPDPEMFEDLATPYRLEQNNAVPVMTHRSGLYPAGDVYLEASAMARILQMYLNNGKYGSKVVLSESSIVEMRRPQFGGNTGLDFGIRTISSERFVEHGGNIPGFTSKFILGIDSKVGVYVASNTGMANIYLNIIAQLAIDLLMGKEIGTGLIKEITGIGIGLEKNQNSGFVQVSDIIPGSPASRFGLQPGYIIETINGISTRNLSVQNCLEIMKGPVGTEIQFAFTNYQNENPIVLKKEKFIVPG